MEMWTKNGPNILLSDNIAKVKAALESGCIFGHHYHYRGGRAFTIWAYSNFIDYMDHLSLSRPGDLFVVWSTVQLIEKGMTLVSSKYVEKTSGGGSLISEVQRETISKFLTQDRNEIIAVFQNLDQTVARMFELDELVDFDELLVDFGRPNSELSVFSIKDIDTGENISVEAKYPNERGEIPKGGAY